MWWDLILSTNTLLLLMALCGSAILPTVLLWRSTGRKMVGRTWSRKGRSHGEGDSNQCHNFHSHQL